MSNRRILRSRKSTDRKANDCSREEVLNASLKSPNSKTAGARIGVSRSTFVRLCQHFEIETPTTRQRREQKALRERHKKRETSSKKKHPFTHDMTIRREAKRIE